MAVASARRQKRKDGLPPSVRKHAEVLCVLAKAKPKLVKQIIAGADNDLLKGIAECGHNVLQGVVPLTPKNRQKLRRHKTALRTLVNRKTSAKSRKTLLMRGGFVGALLGAVAPLIASALGGLFSSGRR